MKNLLIILASILPMALMGQSEVAKTDISTKKNTITASSYLGSSSGLALDYRRVVKKNQEFIVGVHSSYAGLKGMNVGFRKYYNPENKLHFGIGLDAGLKQRNIIGNNFVSRALENTLLKVNYTEIRVVAGAYYQLDDKLDLMAELLMKPAVPFLFNLNNRRRIKIGLKYHF